MSGPGAGKLDREITIQRAPLIQSDSGESRLDWEHATEEVVWAEWVPQRSLESYFANDRIASHVTGFFRMYDMAQRPTPDATRILWDGRIFDVRPYVEVGRSDWLEVAVEARGE